MGDWSNRLRNANKKQRQEDIKKMMKICAETILMYSDMIVVSMEDMYNQFVEMVMTNPTSTISKKDCKLRAIDDEDDIEANLKNNFWFRALTKITHKETNKVFMAEILE